MTKGHPYQTEIYDKAYLFKLFVWIGLTSAALKATGGTAMTLALPVALLALGGGNPVTLFFTVLIMISATVGNDYFFPKGMVFAMSVRATLLVLAVFMSMRASGRKTSPVLRPFMGIFLYIGWSCLSSGQGYSPIVSYLKIILFSAIYMAFYAVANEVINNIRADAARTRSVILSFATLFVAGSFALIFVPGIGIMRQTSWTDPTQIVYLESLFMGMARHSQSLGPIIAMFSVIILGDLLFSVKKADKLYVALLAMTPILIYKTSSRTAMGTYMAGLMLLIWFFMHARGFSARWKGKVMSISWFVAIFCLVAAFCVPKVRDRITSFALKRSMDTEVQKGDLTLSAITSSRQGLAESAMANFRKSPVFGNGFQVSEDMKRDHRSGLVAYLSAPIEKGVWVTAILEEGGAVGFILFAGFLIVTFSTLVKRHAYISATMLFTVALSNMGEFTIFSMSYTGGLSWALVFAAVVLDAHRLRQIGMERMFQMQMEQLMEMERSGMQ